MPWILHRLNGLSSAAARSIMIYWKQDANKGYRILLLFALSNCIHSLIRPLGLNLKNLKMQKKYSGVRKSHKIRVPGLLRSTIFKNAWGAGACIMQEEALQPRQLWEAQLCICSSSRP